MVHNCTHKGNNISFNVSDAATVQGIEGTAATTVQRIEGTAATTVQGIEGTAAVTFGDGECNCYFKS